MFTADFAASARVMRSQESTGAVTNTPGWDNSPVILGATYYVVTHRQI